jgi:ABC-type transport system involved in multi-copper enzyme maturation permease subunit
VNTLVIARLTFREALRRRALYGAVALTLAFLLLYAWGTGVAVRELNEAQATAGGINRMARQLGLDLRLVAVGELLLAGLYAVSNIAALLAIFLGAVTVAQEIELGTLQSIIPKPIARWQVVLGKWLGGVAMLAVYVACTSALAAAIIYWRAGYLPDRLALGILLLVLKATLLFSLTLVGSTLAPMIATGVVMLIIFVVANVTAMVEQVGQIVGSQVMVRIGVVASLIVPSEALWKMGAALVQPPNPLPALGLNMTLGPFSVLNPPTMWMGVYGVGYIVLAVALATLVFSRRDL